MAVPVLAAPDPLPGLALSRLFPALSGFSRSLPLQSEAETKEPAVGPAGSFVWRAGAAQWVGAGATGSAAVDAVEDRSKVSCTPGTWPAPKKPEIAPPWRRLET